MSKKVFLYYILFLSICSFGTSFSADRQKSEITTNKESISNDEELNLFLDGQSETEITSPQHSNKEETPISQQISENEESSATQEHPTRTDAPSTLQQTTGADIDIFDEDEEEDIFSSLEETNELDTNKDKQKLKSNSFENTPDLTEIHPQNNSSTIIEAEYANIALLDKNTGQRHIYKMYANDTISYCNFEITLIKCVKNINPFKQDDLAFFTIYKKDSIAKNMIFSGWISKNNIFTSNISKSIILISVLECCEK